MSYFSPRDQEEHKKDRLAVYHWLLGRNYALACFASTYASSFSKNNKRKDNITPEFNHQVSIAMLMRTLNSYLEYPEETFVATFLHDVCEDYPVSYLEVRKVLEDKLSSFENIYKRENLRVPNIDLIMQALKNLNKKENGLKIDDQTYYDNMIKCPISSIVKGGDRVHNQSTMVNTFTPKKQKDYLKVTVNHTLRMVKEAQKQFPSQNHAYENIKFLLKMQVETFSTYLDKLGNK